MRRTLTPATLAVALAATPLAAQQHQHGEPVRDTTGQGMMHCAGMEMLGGMTTMMQAMRFSPRNILSNKTELQLTTEQTAKIEALASPPADRSPRRTDLESLRGKVWRAFEALPPDTAAIRATLEQMASRGARLHADQLVRASLARAALTATQRSAMEKLAHPCPMMEVQPTQPPARGHPQHHGGH